MTNSITQSVITRGDLAHLALFLWATGASALLAYALRSAAETSARVDAFMTEFLQELSRFNKRIEEKDRDA